MTVQSVCSVYDSSVCSFTEKWSLTIIKRKLSVLYRKVIGTDCSSHTEHTTLCGHKTYVKCSEPLGFRWLNLMTGLQCNYAVSLHTQHHTAVCLPER
jgi:hypothetical protein